MPANKAKIEAAALLASNLPDQVDELRGKAHLKERDAKANYECSENVKTENDALIAELRAENKRKRLTMAYNLLGDKHVIRDVFQERKVEYLSMKRRSAEQTISEMDQKSCEANKLLNDLIYQRIQKEELLEQQQDLLNKMLHKNTGQADPASEREFRRLENEQHKARIKYEAAKNITRRYEEVLQYIQKECQLYPTKLDLLEQMVIDARKEHRELKKMNKKAAVSNEESRKDLMNMEREMYQARRVRDQQLSESKKEVERRKEPVETKEKRSKVATIGETNEKAAKHQAMKAAKHEKILTLEDSFEKIKQTINISNINDVVFRIANQDDTHERLKRQKKDKLAQKAKLSEELEKAKKAFEELKFTSQRKAAKGRQMVDNIEQQTLEEEKRLDAALIDVGKKEKLLVDLQNGISTLFEKLDEIKLKPPYHNFRTGDPVNDLNTCEKKIDFLTEMISFEKSVGVTLKNANNKKLHEFLEKSLPIENVRVKLDIEDTSDADDFHFDHDQDNEGFVSRDDCKKMGQDILGSKIKPKKRKGKKSKRN